MSLHITPEGKVVITTEETGIDAVEMLHLKRQAIYEAMQQHNRKDFIQSDDMYFGLIELLRDTEPSPEQYQKLLKGHQDN